MTIPTRPPEPLPAVDLATFLAAFPTEMHAALRAKALEPGAAGLFMAECHDFNSSQFGGRYAVQYGPDRTFKAEALLVGGLIAPNAGSGLRYTMMNRVPREEFEMATQTGELTARQQALIGYANQSNGPASVGRGSPVGPAHEIPEPDETGRAWPTLFKKTTGGKTQEWQIWVEKLATSDCGRIHTRYGLSDGKKQEQQDIVEKGKNAGKKNATTPYQQACLEAAAEWTKQLTRKGYGRTVERSAEVRGSSPMLAHPVEKVKPADIDWDNAHGQPKLDGFRCLATKQGGVVTLRSRENKPIETVPHIADALRPHLQEGATLDGELYVHGMAFQTIASLVKKAQPDSERIEYHVYDALLPDQFELRLGFVRTVVGAATHPRVLAVETVTLRTPDELAEYQAKKIAAGFEGAMLRHSRAGYEAGKRSKTLLKVKTFQDEEFEVVEVREGRGTHKGMAILLCVTAAGHRFEVTAPGSHDEKRAHWANRAALVGRRLTTKFFEYTAGDAPVPRFPVALRFREDL